MTATYHIDPPRHEVTIHFQKATEKKTVTIHFDSVPDTWQNDLCWIWAATSALQTHSNTHNIRKVEALPPLINTSGHGLGIMCL